MLLEVVFVLYEKVATNGTFVTTVSYGTHIFYFFLGGGVLAHL